MIPPISLASQGIDAKSDERSPLRCATTALVVPRTSRSGSASIRHSRAPAKSMTCQQPAGGRRTGPPASGEPAGRSEDRILGGGCHVCRHVSWTRNFYGGQHVAAECRVEPNTLLLCQVGRSQAVAEGKGGCGRSGDGATGADLGVDVGDMALDGADAQHQGRGDVLVAFAGGNQA
jgi:hypothetical protein